MDVVKPPSAHVSALWAPSPLHIQTCPEHGVHQHGIELQMAGACPGVLLRGQISSEMVPATWCTSADKNAFSIKSKKYLFFKIWLQFLLFLNIYNHL